MIKLARKLLRNDDGASAAEYALILAVIGGGIVVAFTLLGTNIRTAVNSAAADVTYTRAK